MIRKVYEVDPIVCPKCGGTMKVIAFLSDFSVVDHIITHLKLKLVAERPPPPRPTIFHEPQRKFLFILLGMRQGRSGFVSRGGYDLGLRGAGTLLEAAEQQLGLLCRERTKLVYPLSHGPPVFLFLGD